MKIWIKLGAVVLSCSVLGWGCSKEQEREPPARTAAATEAPAPANGKQAAVGESAGSISGTVVYKGSWKSAAIAVSRDQEVCGKEKEDPSLVLSAPCATEVQSHHGSQDRQT